MQSPCPQWTSGTRLSSHARHAHTRVMQSRALTLGAAAALASAAFVQQRAWRAERDSPPLGRIVEVDGARVHYLERGRGTPLVMLHGNGSMLQELRLSGLYELAAARYRVILPDRPGHGHSTRPRREWWGPRPQAAPLRAPPRRVRIGRPIVFRPSFGRARRARLRARLPSRHARRSARFGLLLPDGAARRPVYGVSGDSTAGRPDAAHGLAAYLARIVAAHAEGAVQPGARAALLPALPHLDGVASIAAARGRGGG